MSLKADDGQDSLLLPSSWWDVFKEISWHVQNTNPFMNSVLLRQPSAISNLLYIMLLGRPLYSDRLKELQRYWLYLNARRKSLCLDNSKFLGYSYEEDANGALDLSTRSQTSKLSNAEYVSDFRIWNRGSLVKNLNCDLSTPIQADHARSNSLGSSNTPLLSLTQPISSGFKVDQSVSQIPRLSYGITAKRKDENVNNQNEEGHFTGRFDNSVCFQQHCSLLKYNNTAASNCCLADFSMPTNDLEADQLPRGFSPPLNFSAFTRDQNMACPICCKTFRFEKNLLRHLQKIHATGNGESVLKCKLCYYTTKHYSNMYVHIRTHTGDKPYSCSACGVSFTQGSSLKLHIKSRHQDNGQYFSLTRKPGKNNLTKLWTRVLKKDLPKYNALLRVSTSSVDYQYKSTKAVSECSEKRKIICNKGRPLAIGSDTNLIGEHQSDTRATLAIAEPPSPYKFHFRNCSTLQQQMIDVAHLKEPVKAISNISTQIEPANCFFPDNIAYSTILAASPPKCLSNRHLYSSQDNGLSSQIRIKHESFSPLMQHTIQGGAI